MPPPASGGGPGRPRVTRIGVKLIFPVALVSIAVIATYSFFLLRYQEAALTSAVDHHAHQVSETIKAATREDMLLNRREELHRVIEDVAAQEAIERVRIFNKEGTIIYSSDAGLLGSMVDKRAEACFACHAADRPIERLSIPDRTRLFPLTAERRALGIINPIYNEASCSEAACHAHDAQQKVLGVLDVTMSLDEVDREFAGSRNRLVLLAVSAVAALALLLWLLIARLVGRPLAQLVAATNALANGDLAYRVPVARRDEFGQLQRSFNEMTERLAEAQEQVYRSDKLASLGRLAAGVAHEINNPLTGVLSYSSYLLNRAPEGSETRVDLETVVRETKRCRDIVKQLLDFSRQVPTARRPVALAAVIDDALGIVRNQLSLDNIRVARNLAQDLPEIVADRGQIQQVFINLLVNAADAIGHEGGEIAIAARPVASGDRVTGVEVEVRDTGCGIPSDRVSRVFEPFYTTKEGKGTGLGLSVVWGIMDRHGGSVEIASEIDRGTTVTLRFPLGGAPEAVTGERHAA